MKIETRDFGRMEIDETEILHFESAIFGFEEKLDYVLLSDDSIEMPFTWLQAVDSKETCFILLNPQLIWEGYAPELPPETKKLLRFTSEQQPVILAISVIPQEFSKATVNLKSPIIINTATKRAAQVVLEAEYPVRAPLLEQGEGTC